MGDYQEIRRANYTQLQASYTHGEKLNVPYDALMCQLEAEHSVNLVLALYNLFLVSFLIQEFLSYQYLHYG